MKEKCIISGNFNKFKNSYIETRIRGEFIDYKTDSINIFKISKDKKNIVKYNDNIYFCNFRTKFNDEDCVLSFFIIRSDKKSSENELGLISIEIINMMERNFYPIYFKEYKKSKTSDDKLVSFLKIVTPIK